MAPDSPGPEARLLVVEDDPGISELLFSALSFAGFEVRTAATAGDALREVAARPPDLIVLDIMLPDGDGFDVLRRIRGQISGLPVLFLSARDGVADRVAGLTLGAADYVVKPFSMDEVLARIRAVLRRSRQPAGQVLQHGALSVDLRTHKVSVSGQQIAVTPKEFAILECLASDPGRVVSRQEMLERAWDEHWYGPTKVLDVHMAALRRKLGDPGIIETVYGHGFRLADPDGHR